MLPFAIHPPASILDGFATLLAYTPFLSPLPVWDFWPLLLVPLSAAVAIVYKSLKLPDMRDVPWQAFVITCWIVFGMIGGAIVLRLIVWIVDFL